MNNKKAKIIVATLLFLSIILFPGAAYDEYITTPTDLTEEIIVEAEKEINIDELYPNHHIEIKVIQRAHCIGDEVILGFELIDYPPGKITEIQWEYSLDNIEWFPIEGETNEVLKFTVTKENCKYWYRVMVSYHFDLNI